MALSALPVMKWGSILSTDWDDSRCAYSLAATPMKMPVRLPRNVAGAPVEVARGRDRWVINKIRALCAWYSKGLEGGSHLRTRVNSAASLAELHEIVEEFFFAVPAAV